MDKSIYTVEEMCAATKYLTPFFDVVRVVDPTDNSVIEFCEDGTIKKEPYTCYKVWNKSCRCENCSSMCAVESGQRMSKYEFILNSIFYVVSNPVSIVLADKSSIKVVLEIVSRVSDHLLMERRDNRTIAEFVEDIERKIYRDELTDVYNRRYFEEYIFLHRNTDKAAKQVAFLVIDLKGFKKINDSFGHIEGDEILRKVAKNLGKCIRKSDSLIRIGGDEFLITMINCEENDVPKKAEQFKSAIAEIKYGKNNELVLKADVGYSFNNSFKSTDECTGKMLKEADDAMYREKHIGIK